MGRDMLDTLTYAKRLRSVGFTEEQAEAQASALYDAVTSLTATKLDVVEAKNETKEVMVKEFTGVRSEISDFKDSTAEEFAAVRSEISDFKDSTAEEFAAVRSEISDFKEAVAREFAKVRREIAAFKEAVALEFTGVRREIAEIRLALQATNGRVALLNWMAGFNLALTAAVLVKLLT
ncbi:hypothetical protein C4901_00760 [Acidiferrobacter sp. SPIII_3]|nr:hypothetical protein C4901_00760 [Acidiferrobacter sp. SPIII_3]